MFDLRRLCAGLALLVAVVRPGFGEALYSYATDFDGNGQLYLVDPDVFELTAVGPVHPGAPRGVGALTHGPDGLLYATARPDNIYGLARIEPATGAVTYVGPFGPAVVPQPFMALTFDGAGDLWLVSGPALFSVDPATGFATAAGTLDRAVSALALWNGQIYAVIPVDQTETYGLEILDPATATLSPIFQFAVEYFILDAAFDSRGHLRLFAETGGIPEIVGLVFYEIADLSTGPAVQTSIRAFDFLDPQARLGGIAGGPGRFDVEVPTASWTGLATLIAALLAAGVILLRR